MGTQFRFEWRISEFLLTRVSSDNTDMRWVPVARILQSTSDDTQKSEHWLRRGFISGTGGPVVPEKVQSDACGIADCNAFYSSIRSLCLVNVRSDITGQPSVCVFVLALACRF